MPSQCGKKCCIFLLLQDLAMTADSTSLLQPAEAVEGPHTAVSDPDNLLMSWRQRGTDRCTRNTAGINTVHWSKVNSAHGE